MNKVLYFLLPLFLLTAGCLQIPQGFTPDEELKTAGADDPRYDVTFSVDYLVDGGMETDDGIASHPVVIDYVRDHLARSGAFSRIEYKSFAEKSNYHLHFIVHYSTASRHEVHPYSLLVALTLTALPGWQTGYLDMSSIVYLNQKPIYSPSVSEGLRNYIWIGFLPVGLVWNNWWAWTTQEKKCVRFLVNRITDHQRTLP